MCFQFSPEVLMVITLGFFFFLILLSYLQGAIIEASTSNFAEIKQIFLKKKKEREEKCWKHSSSY